MQAEPRSLVRGPRGLVKCGYAIAAEVAPFDITIDPSTRVCTLHGTVAPGSNPYLLQQRPLEFLVPTMAAACWPIETLTIAAGEVVGRLGALVTHTPTAPVRSVS
jgi:hypothetical protein